MTSEPIGGDFTIFWSVTTDEPLTKSEVLTRASLPALGSRHDDYHDFELVKITPESTADPLKWKIHLTYRKATMYEKLIDALRAEASVVAERHYASTDNKNARLIDIADALANVAARLEGGGNCTGIGAEPDAEISSDDDEPLTAEWLESAQPAFLAADADYIIALYRTPACGRVTMAISGSAATLEYVTTRGDYRALRRMLGVPMEDA